MRSELPLVAYSAGNFGKNLLLGGVDVTLLFMLTDLIGITPAAVSTLMLVVLLGDLAFDLGSGILSSWAGRFGFGYRRIVALSAAPCCLAFAMIYSLPALGVRDLTLLALTLLAFRLSYAIFDVPHNSLLAGVAPDSHARGRASGYRVFFSTLASLLTAVALTPAVIRAARLGQTGQLALLGAAGAMLACLALWISAWPPRPDRREQPCLHSARPIAVLPRLDRLFAGIATIAFVTGFAVPMFVRMILYLTTYTYDRPSMAPQLLLAITIGQLPGVIVWTYLVRHAEKVTLLAFSYMLTAACLFLFAIAAPQEQLLLSFACLLGAGFAGVFMLPWGIVADAIDFAEFCHGERRETATFATVLVIIKAGSIASVGFIAWALARLGYVAGADQTPRVLLGMKMLAFGVPLAGCALAVPVLARMSIGHARHARILRVLKARRPDRRNRRERA